MECQGAHEARGSPRGVGRAPTLVDRWRPPDVDLYSSIFYIFQNNSPLIFRSFRELLFLHKNNTMAILLKTASVRVSSIQIMQVRVQNKGKSVWKSRYDGDVSPAQVWITEASGKGFLIGATRPRPTGWQDGGHHGAQDGVITRAFRTRRPILPG